MTYKVGLTGGVACGKSTVTDLFQQLGATIIDADLIARGLLEKGTESYQQVVACFGEDVLLQTGDIDRAWLRAQIFSDRKAKQTLENIIHPRVRQQMIAAAKDCEAPYCILSVPLLIEAQMQDLVDRVVVVDADEKTQLRRLMARDRISEAAAIRMLQSQCQRAQRLAIADDIIDNSQTLDMLRPQVEQLHQQYLELAKNTN